jgi:asparagine synthase (glutamine-hydrolysing)
MCGIAGILRLSTEEGTTEAPSEQKILDLLKHRGPDARRTFTADRLTLYHSRLQIIDTSDASAQPFFYKEKNDALVYNGEIFNYKELAKTLSGLTTEGDVEVLYRLVQEKRAGALPLLNGFFAFAYWDGQGSLLLARDRFGEKPLYYFHDKRIFAFASELKALMELIGPQELDHEQLYTYLRVNYCTGGHTIFRHVKRLLPGQVLTVNDTKITKGQWYTVPENGNTGDLATLLDDAVRIRLRADVPVGAFLSGGLDSSIISALAKKHHPSLKTFSIGFKNEKFLDETAYAEVVAKHIGSDHTTIKLGEEDFLENIDNFLNSIDEPFADSSAFNLFMLAKHCATQVKVALSGDGADELFKGYNKHRAFMLSAHKGSKLVALTVSGLLGRIKSSRANKSGDAKRKLDKFAMLSSLPHEERIKFLASVCSHQECSLLLNTGVSSIYFDSLFTHSHSTNGLSAEDRFDMEHVLADDMLVKTDRFSMRHGLEVRSPFLDHRVVEFALNEELSNKISISRQKIILRKTFAALLPKETITRSKKGFEVPLERWLQTELRTRIEKEWLSGEALATHNLFGEAQVGRLLKDLWAGIGADTPARVWALIVFQQWWKNYSQYVLLADETSAGAAS